MGPQPGDSYLTQRGKRARERKVARVLMGVHAIRMGGAHIFQHLLLHPKVSGMPLMQQLKDSIMNSKGSEFRPLPDTIAYPTGAFELAWLLFFFLDFLKLIFREGK